MIPNKLKLFIFVFVVFLVMYLVLYNNSAIPVEEKTSVIDNRYNFKIPDLHDNFDTIPSGGQSIFFLETSKPKGEESVVTISARQACAVESAARLNPHLRVYLLFNVPLYLPEDSCNSFDCMLIHTLVKYDNVLLRTFDPENYFAKTPLEEWFRGGALQKSSYLVEHTSDVLRLLTLWKFGGTYLDLDIVVLRSFEGMEPNFGGEQSDVIINNAVLNFAHNGSGHHLAELCLNELKTNYVAKDWGHNGPGVITRVMQKSCNVEKTAFMTPEKCEGYRVYPQSAFYAVPYLDWEWFFDERRTEEVLKMINGSYAVHLWNKLSRHRLIDKRKTNQGVYAKIVQEHCPNVYNVSGDTF